MKSLITFSLLSIALVLSACHKHEATKAVEVVETAEANAKALAPTADPIKFDDENLPKMSSSSTTGTDAQSSTDASTQENSTDTKTADETSTAPASKDEKEASASSDSQATAATSTSSSSEQASTDTQTKK